MIKLDALAPSHAELDLTTGMPEQVAIGYVRAMRKANGGKRFDFTKPGDLSDLFPGIFKR